MPLTDPAYPEISIRLARILGHVAQQRTQREIASALSLSLSTIRGEVARAETVTGCANKRELGRWWEAHRLQWARWFLAQIDIQPRDLAG